MLINYQEKTLLGCHCLVSIMNLMVKTLLTFTLATNTLAAPTQIQERDLPTITGVLSTIGTKVDALGTAIQGYTGGDVSKLQQASNNLVAAINNGNKKVSGTGALTAGDALGLPGPVNDLKNKISTVITKLDGKKAQIVKAGKGAQTYNDLTQQKAAAKKARLLKVSGKAENAEKINKLEVVSVPTHVYIWQ